MSAYLTHHHGREYVAAVRRRGGDFVSALTLRPRRHRVWLWFHRGWIVWRARRSVGDLPKSEADAQPGDSAPRLVEDRACWTAQTTSTADDAAGAAGGAVQGAAGAFHEESAESCPRPANAPGGRNAAPAPGAPAAGHRPAMRVVRETYCEATAQLRQEARHFPALEQPHVGCTRRCCCCCCRRACRRQCRPKQRWAGALWVREAERWPGPSPACGNHAQRAHAVAGGVEAR